MKGKLGVLVGMGAVLVAAIVWISRPNEDPDPDLTVSPETPHALADEQPAAVTDREAVGEAPNEPVEVTQDDSANERTRAASSRDVIWVEGRIALDPAAPADEHIIVRIEGAKHRNGQPTCEVDARSDGRFRAAVAAGTRKAKLTIAGRYHYLSEPLAIDVTEIEQPLTVEPELGGLLLVEVTAPDDDPGALEVWAEEVDHYRSTRFESEALGSGRFEIPALPTDAIYRVGVRAANAVDKESEGVSPKPGESISVGVELLRGCRVSGLVSDEAGTPLAGVEVSAKARRGRGNLAVRLGTLTTTSKKDGTFELRGIAPGLVDLRAELEGRVPASEALGRVEDREELTDLALVLESGATIAGVVIGPDGEPLAEAYVFAQDERNSWTGGQSAETDANGAFEIVALTAESYRVIGRWKEEAGDGVWTGGRGGVLAGAPDLVLELGPGNLVSGTVIDDLGAPVEKYQLSATPVGDAPGRIANQKTTKKRFKSDDGSFELPGLDAGRWQLAVSAHDYADARPLLVDLPEQGAALRFMCTRLGMVAGQVLDAAGNPVAGATVTATAPDGSDRTKESRDDGTFAIDKVTPGPVRLTAKAPGHAPAEEVAAEVRPGEQRDGLTLRLTAGATLVGEVHSEVWSQGARKVLSSPAAEYSFVEAEVDADGHFEVHGLEAGFHRVSLDWRGTEDWISAYATRHEEIVELVAGLETHVVLGAPSSSTIRVTGTVTNDGAPVDGYVVYVFKPGGPSNQPVTITHTDAEGTFEATLDEPGLYRFSIGAEQTKQTIFDRDVPASSTVQYSFAMPTGSIRGRILGPNGEPRARHWLMATVASAPADTREFGEIRNGTTDSDGYFEINNLVAGRYRLRTGGMSAGNASNSFGIVVLNDLEVPEGGTLEVEVRLEPEAILEGRVTTADGQPVAGAVIGARYPNGEEQRIWKTMTTDYSGWWRLRALAPGEVTVHATLGERTVERSVTAYEGETSFVDLVLD